MRIIYHWLNGSSVSSRFPDFDSKYLDIKALYGHPACAQVLWDVDR